jgi:hypothetical protein
MMKAAELFKRADEVYGMRKTAFLAGIEAYCRVNGMNMQQAFIMTKVAEEMLEGSGDVNEAIVKVAAGYDSSWSKRISNNLPQAMPASKPIPASKPMPSVGGVSQNPLSANQPGTGGASGMPPAALPGTGGASGMPPAALPGTGGASSMPPAAYVKDQGSNPAGGWLRGSLTDPLTGDITLGGLKGPPEPISPNAPPAEQKRYNDRLARFRSDRDASFSRDKLIALQEYENLTQEYDSPEMGMMMATARYPKFRQTLEQHYQGPDGKAIAPASYVPTKVFGHDRQPPAAADPSKTGPLSE